MPSKQQPAVQSVSAVTVSSAVPLLVDIKAAAQTLGISVFAVRNLCWHPQHRTLLAPVRQGAKYLFHPAKLSAFVDALIAGKISFPSTPVKTKRKVTR